MQKSTQALLAGGAGAALTWFALRRTHLDLRGKSVLITGGSRGLGLLMAREFSNQGARLTLVARDEAELDRAQYDLLTRNRQAPAIVIGDVADERTARRSVEAALDAHGRLDILVNNAGIIQTGPLQTMSRHDFAQAMDVHFWGMYHMIMAAQPHLRHSGKGRIVNITSIGGKLAVPHLLPYAASKFAAVGLSDGLRAELAAEDISVTTVVPGLMRTGSPVNARFKGRHKQEYFWFTVSDSLPITSINAQRAARQIIAACRRGQPQLVIGWQAQALILAQALAPGLVARMTKLAARLLPDAPESGGKREYSGWESQSKLAPSGLTALSDQAALQNNEIR
ncbi:MAG: SDR family NAD(P)-dependent oxidoreductase [Oscillochloris sp.]|nr:SDR family NAD(P)-dependent oxidoreductase [Oscillochloris sp.]